MAVQSVVSMVIQKLTDLLIQESSMFNKQIDDVENIRITLRQMQSFLKDVEDKQKSDDTVQLWVKEFLCTVYNVEDAVETFVMGTKPLRKKRFIKYIFIIKEWKASYNLRREMRKINKQLSLSSFPKSSSNDSTSKPSVELGISVEESSRVIGFKEDAETLVSWLIDTSDPKLHVISIEGEGGSGKTTLATIIYDHTHIKQHFECRVWVSVSKSDIADATTDSPLTILKQMRIELKEERFFWSQQSEHQNENESPQEKMMEKLPDCLKEKRCLIVMDGVRTPNVWQKLQGAFPVHIRNGSRVMLTTGNRDVAFLADQSRRHRIKPLNDEVSWKLFLNKVQLADDNNPQFSNLEMIKLKEKILKQCKGLPLAIVVLGEVLLKAKQASYKEWSQVLENPSWQLDGKDERFANIMALKYNDLPFHLRPCFLYLGLFPREYEIPVRRLLRLWLAEGFVKQSPGMTPEDLAEKYLDDLVNRKMIEIARRSSDGSPKTCCMLGDLHDIFLSKAEDIGLFHIHKTSDYKSQASPSPPPFPVRRLVERLDIKDYPCSDLYIRHLRSYSSFNSQKKDKPAVEIGNFLGKIIGNRGFGLLRVLDLEGIYKPRLPEDLGNLFHLRYLGLRWTFLDSLPSSVGNLPYLETLDVKHTCISTLHSSIWKMKHLRHLCLNEIRLDMSVQKSLSYRSSLTQLQTLWGLFVDEKSPVKKNGLNRLINLRKLGLTCHSASVKDLGEWIERLAGLHFLRLRSKDEKGQPSSLELNCLSSLQHLSHLYLLGNLPKLHHRSEFPPNLRVLTLSVSQLKEDPMPTLALLPSLSVLKLLAGSYLGNTMICPGLGFRELRVLKLWMLQELEEWTVEAGAMRSLRVLEIRCCNSLKTLPDRLLNLTSIEKLIFTNMPKEFANDDSKINHKKIERKELKLTF